jgi:hypothetical protein
MANFLKWGESNLFSESHRVCLPSNYCLFDVDGILLDSEMNPKFLYEEKYKMVSKDKGDFIKTFYSSSNAQASYLRYMSQSIVVYIHETTTNKWWYVDKGTLEETNNPNLDKVKTANRVYVQDIRSGYSHRISGVFVRTEGEKPSEMEIYGDFIANIIGAPKVLVNDVFESSCIHFKKENIEFKCESKDEWGEKWDEVILV